MMGDYQFIPLDDRRFVTVDVDLTSQDSADGRADSQLAERGHSRLHANGGSADQAPGMGARTPEPPAIDETEMIATALMDAQPQEGDVFRIRYRATDEQHRRVDRQALLGFLAEAGVDRVHGPTWEPVRTVRSRVEVDGDGMTDADALAMWCKAAERTEEERAALQDLLGEEALA